MLLYKPYFVKIIDGYEVRFGFATTIDAHSTEPWIVLGHNSGTVSIWNLQNETVKSFLLQPRDAHISAIRLIEPLKCLVIGDDEGYIHVNSYVKVHKLQKFRAHGGSVSSLAVHPSEPFVLSASLDKLIKLWNWEAGWQCIGTFEGHLDSVNHVRFNPQTAGNSFASSSDDSTIKIWNLHSPIPVASLDCGTGTYRQLDYFIPSGDRQYLVTSSRRGNAQIFDAQTNTTIKHINGLQPVGCNIGVVGPPGRPILLTVSHDQTVSFCDSVTHRYENRVDFELGLVHSFAYVNKIRSLVVLCYCGIAIMEID